jgi:molybdopterin molybdotransferase
MDKISLKPQGPGCDVFDPDSLPLDVAIDRILSTLSPVTETTTKAIRKALGRVLAVNVTAPDNVPNHTNSAMDGFALAGNDLSESGLATLTEVGAAFAGKPYLKEVKQGETVRIMTGAVMPSGTDTVAMKEYIEASDTCIQLTKAVKLDQNVRAAGEDIKQGQTVLHSGRRITVADLGLLASLGIKQIKVFKKPRVAFFSNGDELKQVGESLALGELYDSNRYTLHGLLKRAGAKLVDLGVAGDSYEAIREAMIVGDKQAQMVITSAGASVGEADYVYDILQELGEVDFWKLAIKPGRPLAFGQLGNSSFFGLPGNPVSVMVTFALCVRPALAKLSGEAALQPITLNATTLSKLRKRPGRAEYQRAVYKNNPAGELVVEAFDYQGSGVLSSMSVANCFIVLDLQSEGADIGEQVQVLPFSEVF